LQDVFLIHVQVPRHTRIIDPVEIVSKEGNLPVEAHLRPAEFAFLRLDRLPGHNRSLDAKLEHISADTITNENGESFHLIRVRTDWVGWVAGMVL